MWAAPGDTLGVLVGSGISFKLSPLSDVSMGSRSCVYMHVHVWSHDHVCIYTCMCASEQVCMCMCRVVIRCIHACVYVQMHIHRNICVCVVGVFFEARYDLELISNL